MEDPLALDKERSADDAVRQLEGAALGKKSCWPSIL